jgi:hypothetical protein
MEAALFLAWKDTGTFLDDVERERAAVLDNRKLSSDCSRDNRKLASDRSRM